MNKWYNMDIDKDNFELFRIILKSKHIPYEVSSAESFLLHLEINCDEYEASSLSKIIEGLDELTQLPF